VFVDPLRVEVPKKLVAKKEISEQAAVANEGSEPYGGHGCRSEIKLHLG
jgi:hypothetical protein